MRDLVKVIDDMINEIPDKSSEIVKEMERIKADQINYTAPESMVRWEEIQCLLSDNFNNPKYDWEFKILSIWTMKSVEELRDLVINKESDEC